MPTSAPPRSPRWRDARQNVQRSNVSLGSNSGPKSRVSTQGKSSAPTRMQRRQANRQRVVGGDAGGAIPNSDSSTRDTAIIDRHLRHHPPPYSADRPPAPHVAARQAGRGPHHCHLRRRPWTCYGGRRPWRRIRRGSAGDPASWTWCRLPSCGPKHGQDAVIETIERSEPALRPAESV